MIYIYAEEGIARVPSLDQPMDVGCEIYIGLVAAEGTKKVWLRITHRCEIIDMQGIVEDIHLDVIPVEPNTA